ncbi:MAG: hypothetical protein J6T63_04920 [Bacteroidales bacterium]|nr:hypothetical protein [Bacteroidales bacterium]
MKKSLLILAIVSVAGMLASCNGNGKTAANENEEVPTDVVVEEPTTGSLAGHDWVDLGLPSGTKWATCNVGASKPEEYGDYFAWGETTMKEECSWINYSFRESGDAYGNVKFNKYKSDGRNGVVDSLDVLETADDAAAANWGNDWRMPTKQEMKELDDSCKATWTTKNGVQGCLITGPNGNSIFLPAAGYRNITNMEYLGTLCGYWSSSDDTHYSYAAWSLICNMSSCYIDREQYRYYGLSIRPVCAN